MKLESRGSTISAVFRRAVDDFGPSSWLECHGESLTYRAGGVLVTRIERALAACVFGQSDGLGLFLGNHVDWIPIEFAAVGRGGFLVPLNTILTARELRHAISDSGVSALVWGSEVVGKPTLDLLLELVPELQSGPPGTWTSETFPQLRTVVGRGPGPWPPGVLRWEDFLSAGEVVDEAVVLADESAVEADSAALVLYTSGTTGSPKGAMLSNRGVVRKCRAWAEHLQMSALDVSLLPSPLFWTFGCTINAVMPIHVGSTLLVQDRFEAADFVRTVGMRGVTHIQAVPAQYELIWTQLSSDDAQLPSVRVATMGGSIPASTLIGRLHDVLPHASLVSSYGLTEGTAMNTWTELDDPTELIASSVGHVASDNEADIRTSDGGPVELGEVGELWLRGDSVMQGYINNPDATAQSLVDGWLRTGDIATRDEQGYIRIVGRISDAYKSGGMNVYPAEVEEVLVAHDGVASVAVRAVPDERMGEVGAAFVVPTGDARPTGEELRAFCRVGLASYKVPRYFQLVDELPMTATGKVKKFELILEGASA